MIVDTYVERAGSTLVIRSLPPSLALMLRSALHRGKSVGRVSLRRRGYDSQALSALIDRYHDGRPLSPAEKHLVRSELLGASRPSPSLTDHIARLEARLGQRDDTEPDVATVTSTLLARPDQDGARRRDLTRLHTVTIDDASTVEIDDGLSASSAGDGRVRVFVHVADPTRYLGPEDPLAASAGERVRTLYLPHARKPMLPMALGADACSLREGVETPSLTVTAVVRLEDGSLVEGSSDVMTSVIRSSGRLTYEAVDAVIESDSIHSDTTNSGTKSTLAVLQLLLSAARARRRWREPRAALGAYNGDASTATETVLTAGECHVTMERVSRNSPSRDLVAELMILAGEVFAGMGLDHALALPYRSQTAVPIDRADVADLPNTLRRYQLRKHLLKSTMITSPHLPPSTYHHHALGVSAYVQGTSPIRRYVDLLAHWQIKSYLRGETGADPDQLEAAVSTLEKNNRRLTTAERAINHAYLCAYVAGLGPGHVFPSCTLLHWINQDRGVGVMFVPDLGRELVVTINRPAALGDADLPCTTAAADPFTGTLSLTCN